MGSRWVADVSAAALAPEQNSVLNTKQEKNPSMNEEGFEDWYIRTRLISVYFC